jgi:hypothetical protein
MDQTPRQTHSSCSRASFQRNGTASGLLRARTGIHDISQLGQLSAYNGNEKLNFWKSDECNVIK